MPQGGRAIGWFPNNPLHETQLQLDPGDVIVYYTDGLTDAENPARENFGEERLAQAVAQAAGQPAEVVHNHILQAVETFANGVPPFDDLTLMVVRYTG